MKHSFGIICCLTLWLGLMTPHTSAQNDNACQNRNKIDKRNVVELPSRQVGIFFSNEQIAEQEKEAKRLKERLLPVTETKPRKKSSFTFDDDGANYFASDSRLVFNDRIKNRRGTTAPYLNRTFTYIYKNSSVISGNFNRKIKQNSEIDKSESAEQPVQEVFQTRLVYPQERGEVQVTFNSTYDRSKGKSLFQTPVSVEYGITKNWQVEIEWNFQSRRSEIGEPRSGGTGDLSFGTQYSFMNMAGSNFHSAVGLEITLPTANIEKELTEGFIEYEPYFLLAKDFPKLNSLQVFSQIGVGFNQRLRRHFDAEDDEPAAHELNLGVGAFLPVRQIVLTGEFNLSTNRWNTNGKKREIYFTPGIVWRLPHNFEMGFSAPVGLTRDAEKVGFMFKLVYEFNLFADD